MSDVLAMRREEQSASASFSPPVPAQGFEDRLKLAADIVDAAMADLMPVPVANGPRLAEAMRYAVLGPGKRLRPFLVLESAGLFSASSQQGALRVAAALECVHAYSLVHDDLPCMDDDDLRRGRPTVHRAFDEATAVLAGDGLLTIAFEILAAAETDPDPAIRCKLISALAVASGANGMVGGQAMDLAAEGQTLDLKQIKRLQDLKTGALISFGCEAGGLLGRAHPAEAKALADYADALGLAFQIADDILDTVGDAAEVGKATGKDAAAGKATFVSILGLDQARAEAQKLASSAVASLDRFDSRADGLRSAAEFVVMRRA